MTKFLTGSVVIGLVVACSSTSTPSDPDGTPDASTPKDAILYHRDVRGIIEQKCATCHTAGGIGPFALTNYSLVKAQASAVAYATKTRTMPPWHADAACNTYKGNASLTDIEIAFINKWVEGGSLEGNPADYKAPQQTLAAPEFRVDAHMELPVAYKPKVAPDEYRCFILDQEFPATKYATGLRVTPGNPAIVHHLISYVVKPSDVQAFKDLDAKDADPGWLCFGGPGGGNSSIAMPWLSGWAPGELGGAFPAGTGVKIAAGSKIIVQMHYNTLIEKNPAPDRTAVDVTLADTVEKEAMVLRFLNPEWLQGKMQIPAGSTTTKHAFEVDITPFLGPLTDGVLKNNTSITLHTSSLHMHTRGKTARLDVIRKDTNKQDCALDIKDWNFHWQRIYGFEKPMVMNPGDKLRIECGWDNSAAKQPVVDGMPLPVKDVNWGEGTQDEMCLGSFYATAN